MPDTSFSVVAMVRETPDVLERFVSYYLALGAEQVRLYFDGEAHEAIVPDLPGVDLTVCDRAWWDRLIGHQPANNGEAMRAVFREAHESGTSDWQFFCDADEFLVARHPMPELLSRIPVSCESVRVANTEAVWGPGDEIGTAFGCTWFRLMIGRPKTRLLRLLLPNRPWQVLEFGFVGHHLGKHFLRRGTAVETFGSHFSVRDNKVIGPFASSFGIGHKDLFVAHFDAISESRWTEKWRRRLSEERPPNFWHWRRVAQRELIEEAIETDTLSQLFRDFYALSRYEATSLLLMRGVIRHDVFPKYG